jgi:ElaB/YqjD/DUF883 family membrane-anchored ribosome-binding protein
MSKFDSFYKRKGEINMSTKNLPTGTDYSDISKEQLISDFKVVAADVEALIKATANQGGESLANLRGKAEQSLATAKAKMADAQEAIVEKGKVAAKATDEYVHDNPWKSIGLSAAVGLVIGLLIGRR